MEPTKEPGLGDYLASFRRRRWLVIGVGLPVLILALVLTVALPTYYGSNAVFRFETSTMSELEGGRTDRNTYLDSYVTKLSENVLQGDSLAKMRDALKLPASGAGDLATLKKAVHVDMTTERILDPESGRQKDLNSGFTLRYDSESPELARQGSQWLADQFLARSRQNRHDRAMEAVNFLQGEAEKYRTDIGALETKLADFKQKHVGELPDSAAAAQGEKERVEQDLLNIEQELGALQQNRIFLQSQLQQSQATNPDSDTLRQLQDEYSHKLSTYDANHPDMLALKRQIELLQRGGGVVGGDSLQSQLATQQAILAQTRQRYSDDHPDVKRLQRSIASLEARIAAGEKPAQNTIATNPVTVQLQTQVNANESQAASLAARRAMLTAKLAQIQGMMYASPQIAKQYEAMDRDVGLARDKYNELLKRKMDSDVTASSALAGSGDEFRLVQAPGRATPSTKSRVAIGIIGVILAAILSLGAALAAEAMDQSVRGSRDLLSILDLSPLAIVPEIRNSRYLKGRRTRLIRLAISLLVGVPMLYVLVRVAVT
jgi:succinoglycan biosynthesis transport protein ExoP